jgi:ParB/RepB/Spo0J family partition protein
MNGSRTSGEVPGSVSVAGLAGERWSGSGSASGGGNRRAFSPDVLIASQIHLTFSLFDATGVSPTRSPLGAFACASSGTAAAVVGIVVVAAESQADRYVVIDGYKRIAALKQLGRDTAEAVVWPMSEAAAVLLDRSLRLSERETALEVGWLLQELEQRFGYSLEELARRFDRSVSWVSRRLALVELLPEAIQQQVREGKIAAQVAMKFLVPVARQSLEDCQRMAAIFAEHHCDTREAGQLYTVWRQGPAAIRKRILDDPALFFKTQRQEKVPPGTAADLIRDLEMVTAIVNRAHRRLAGAEAAELDHQQRTAARQQIERIGKQLQRIDEKLLPEQVPHVEPSTTHHDSGVAHAGSGETRDRAGAGDFPCGCAESPALELHRRAGVAAAGESRALPPTDPGAFRPVQGESRASP